MVSVCGSHQDTTSVLYYLEYYFLNLPDVTSITLVYVSIEIST